MHCLQGPNTACRAQAKACWGIEGLWVMLFVGHCRWQNLQCTAGSLRTPCSAALGMQETPEAGPWSEKWMDWVWDKDKAEMCCLPVSSPCLQETLRHPSSSHSLCCASWAPRALQPHGTGSAPVKGCSLPLPWAKLTLQETCYKQYDPGMWAL